MRIPLHQPSDIPLYRQIETYLRRQILDGVLAPETKLPASRQLAQELGVSRITVNNAYAILESEGLIYSKGGSGVFVLARIAQPANPDAVPPDRWPRWQQVFAQEVELPYEVQQEPPRPSNRHPKPISFTGVGDPREYPVKELMRAMHDVLQRNGASALEYGGLDSGYSPLRATITHVLASQGISAHPDQVLITAGSQQGLALICQLLLQTGDTVLVENPTYNLALELFRTLGLNIIGAPVDQEGMCVEAIEPLLQQHQPRLLYTIPNFQNPTGVCMNGARRRALAAVAERYNVPIVEDDFVGDLRYEGRVQPALITLTPGGRVIYLGTFSKMLMPGLRIGFLVAEGPIYQRLAALKRVSNLSTAPLMQRALDDYVNVGQYHRYVQRSCRLYRQRRDALMNAIDRYLPSTVQVASPQGGLFAWLRLPVGASSVALLPFAAEAGVEYAPGVRFFVNPAQGEPYLRLNFATRTTAEIEEGIRRLATALSRLQ